MAGTTGVATQVAMTGSGAEPVLPSWVAGDLHGRDPAAVRETFEALLLSELLRPLEESLSSAGFFPSGAPGEIYSFFWKQQLGSLLAQGLDLIPDSSPAAKASSVATPADRPLPRVLRAPAMPQTATPPPTERSESPPAVGSTAADHPLAPKLAAFESVIADAAHLAQVGANWLRAVIIQESNGEQDAVSRKGARGLMQLMPATAAALGVRDPFDPVENISAGARYFGALLRRFGDARLALAAYNAGPSRVEAFRGLPPFRETQEFVRRVLALKDEFDRVWPGDAGHAGL